MTAKQYTIEEIKELAGALGINLKNDPASTSIANTATLHGPWGGGYSTSQYGLFTAPGVRPDMFSAFTRPSSFFRAVVQMGGFQRSEFTNEILEVLTGVQAATGTNATGFCADPPTTPSGKVCQQTYVFGDFYAKTELNAVPLIGQRKNRADVPRSVLNSAPTDNPTIPELFWQFPADSRSQLQYELWRFGVALERSAELTLIQGNETLNSTQTEWGYIKEFKGLDRLITTSITDSVSGEDCPAMDSTVITFGADVGATISGGDGRNIVQAVSDLYYRMRRTAEKQGFGSDVQWVFLMREEAFRPLTETYACSYATYRCVNTNAGQPQTQDANTINGLRLEMLNGNYLLIDGIRVPVMFSEGIPQTTVANNTYESDIYLVPMSWAGIPLVNLEYFDMGNPYATEFRSFVNADDMAVLNNGLFLAGYRSTGLCKEYHFASRMRLILETPWLAGRIDNVQYTFQNLPAMAYPGASGYVDGGTTYR